MMAGLPNVDVLALGTLSAIRRPLEWRENDAPAERLALRVRHSSVQPDGRVEVPGSTDFNHVELSGQFRREYWVGSMAFHDAPYRFIDFRHATGAHECH